MIHFIAQITSKKFFLTKREQRDTKEQPLSLCPNCKEEDKHYSYLSNLCGYRKHVVFDLLKDKAEVFYQKMQERMVAELADSVFN